ncbi:MAG TPA: high-potential iron-sulfur protein [Rhodanobacteraceae bacterium]|nr:high-potential iron-sulfur protein [Rhodanobacteraceae bacterium]
MTEQTEPSRRRFLSLLGAMAGSTLLLGALPRRARAADLPHLTEADPTAKALHYTEDASKAPPPHKAGQECANCKFFSGASGGEAYGPCQLYPGKSVAAKGWCAGYSAKA